DVQRLVGDRGLYWTLVGEESVVSAHHGTADRDLQTLGDVGRRRGLLTVGFDSRGHSSRARLGGELPSRLGPSVAAGPTFEASPVGDEGAHLRDLRNESQVRYSRESFARCPPRDSVPVHEDVLTGHPVPRPQV